jgi:hypothetical protein
VGVVTRVLRQPILLEHDSLPDASAWQAIEDARKRFRIGLDAVYGWYERNAVRAALARATAVIRTSGSSSTTRTTGAMYVPIRSWTLNRTAVPEFLKLQFLPSMLP